MTPWRGSDFFVILLSWLVGGIVGALLAGPMVTEDPTAAAFLITLPAQLVGTAVGIWIVATRRNALPLSQSIGLIVEPSDARYLAMGAGLALVLAIVALPLVELLGVEENPQAISDLLGGVREPGVLIAATIGTAVLGPLLEEITYRGILLAALTDRFGRRAGLIWSSVAFGAIHLLGLSDLGRDTVLQAVVITIPSLIVVGAVLGWLVQRTGRLGPAIFTHAGFNLLGLVLLVLSPAAQ